ncbi:unnamed protein product [Protopolystoma xenopodis]|uniref:Dynactin subunit 4 n=1 Tax=Protopolystoma xenopodis TaxID=117903 RepID=A0A448X0M1_9PLAT|nr:unnamed protein product [Protopolystoma xenopodis]
MIFHFFLNVICLITFQIISLLHGLLNSISFSFYLNHSCFLEVSTLAQRHLAPLLQPTNASQLEPRHKALVVKRSMRCRRCEHNMSKADFNPSSIKFRINLSALYHVPEVRIIPPVLDESVVQPIKSSQLHTSDASNSSGPSSNRIRIGNEAGRSPDNAGAGTSLIKGHRTSAHVSIFGPKMQTYLHAKAMPGKVRMQKLPIFYRILSIVH